MNHYRNLNKKELLEIYKNMWLSRLLDEKMITLIKQGKGYFHIGSSGHEAATIAAAKALQPGKDWFFPHYRDMALCLQLGMSAKDILLGFFAKKNDPSSGGRQMPQHFGYKPANIVSVSSPTGTQFLPAVGLAMAAKREKKDDIAYVACGEGTTSQGDFHEALNWASREKAAVIFHVEDNKYAISVPIEENVSGSSVYNITSGYANLERIQVDGTDFFASYEAFKKAVKRARNGEGPTVIISDLVRLLPHSSSDDHRKYRTPEEIEKDKQRDPIPKFFKTCLKKAKIPENELKNVENQAKQEVEEAANWAWKQEEPDPKTAQNFVFASWLTPQTETPPASTKNKIVMVDAINHALHEEMELNPKMVVYGQDVADGKGGVFTATKGLSTKFGKNRVFNAPLAESSIVGTAIGMALYGYKPVVEIQFIDYIFTAMMQIRNELTTMYYRSNGAFQAPVVIRTTTGGYIHGGLCHSQCNEAFFTHMAGLRVFYPSNAADAKGLLKAAIRGQDPVLFLEHKALYRQGFAASPEPDQNYILPPGIAKIVQAGEDLTIITWGLMVHRCLEASKPFPNSVEIIDLRTLCPLDDNTILQSVQKTGKALIVHEENLTGGFGGEIAARIASQAFEYLDGPIQRIAAKDTPIPYNYGLECAILPQTQQIQETIENLLNY